jgi:hypothetical protein
VIPPRRLFLANQRAYLSTQKIIDDQPGFFFLQAGQIISDLRRGVERIGIILLQNEGLRANLRRVAFDRTCGGL